MCFSVRWIPVEKGAFLDGKNLLPDGANSSLYEKSPLKWELISSRQGLSPSAGVAIYQKMYHNAWFVHVVGCDM